MVTVEVGKVVRVWVIFEGRDDWIYFTRSSKSLLLNYFNYLEYNGQGN